MKPVPITLRFLLVLFLSLTLSSCARPGNPPLTADGFCQKEMCLKIAIQKPVVLNQPATVTITLTAQTDYPRLQLTIEPMGAVKVSPKGPWYFSIKAGERLTYQTTATFTEIGNSSIWGMVLIPNSGPVVSDGVRVRMTEAGGQVSPPVTP